MILNLLYEFTRRGVVALLLFTTINLHGQITTIQTFTPASGVAGATVTITGTNFSTTPANNIVYFGAVKATVTSATATQLIATVPYGANYSPITVTVNGLTASSSTPFILTFAAS